MAVVKDFGSRRYWDERFDKEDEFDWLVGGTTVVTLLEPLLKQLNHDDHVLHIGCGTSALSCDLRKAFAHHPSHITNTDYVKNVLEKGNAKELEHFGDVLMRWETVDLLSTDSVVASAWRSTTTPTESNPHLFKLIVDKSTSDSISCSPDVLVEIEPGTSISAEPMVALADNLGKITSPGARWIAVSYSTGRFSFLDASKTNEPSERSSLQSVLVASVCKTWRVIDTKPLLAPRNDLKGKPPTTHAPDIYHTLYILERL